MENKYPIIYDKIEQNTPEWHHIRYGKVTGTGIKKLLVDGDFEFGFGKGANSYAKRIAMQRLSGVVTPDDDAFKTPEKWIGLPGNRGKIFEKEAKECYQIQTFQTVTNVAFIQGGEWYGCSPDGLVYEDGGIEIKVYTDTEKHIDALEGECNHKDQIQFNLFCSKRKWWDFVSYYPELPIEMRLSVHRFFPEKFRFKLYEHKLQEFEKLVNMYVEQKRSNYLLTH